MFVLCKQYQGYFKLSCNLLHPDKHIQRLNFEEKTKIYGVDSLTALKAWTFQDNQNI